MNIISMENKTIVHFNDIVEGLQKLPIPENPVLLVHSSLKSFGYVEGGAETVIKALLNICGSKGTLVLPTLSFKSINEAEPFFDVINTPSDTGYITEIFRKMPNVVRSMHIFSSVAAYGYNAKYITEWHYDTPCGPLTPYGKIIEQKGYVLLLGAGFNTNTLFHCAEEEVDPKYLRYKTIKDVRVLDFNGNTSVRDFRRYDCYQTGINRDLARMESIFRESNVLHKTIIGNSHVTLISAEDNFNISCKLLRDDPSYILTNPEVLNGGVDSSRK
jgi:aminoglycoside 3-N-acetyltransferase